MLVLHKLFKQYMNFFTFYGGGGDSGGGESTTTQGIDPLLKPYIDYGLTESQKLYQTDAPDYYGGQTYVSPSGATKQALQAGANRAMAGNPLLPAAQGQQQDVIEGKYLQNNPFFEDAMRGAAQGASRNYFDTIAKVTGDASRAGRYGSNVFGDMASRASTNFANELTNKYGDLAYRNFADERARQEAASGNAPALAAADYGDIEKLLQVGQGQEAYQQSALDADIARFNFEQNKPYAKLQTYLSSVYGAPMGTVSTTQSSGGGGKIICTAMNHVYGFGSFRNKIWLAQSAGLDPAYQRGYHMVFLPILFFAYDKNKGMQKIRKAVRATLEHVARHRTVDIWKQKRGKRDTLGMVYRAIIEPFCYVVGKLKG